MIKKLFKKVLKIFIDFVDDISLVLGIYFLCKGIFKIYIPAGYISLGICLLALAFFIARKKVIADAYSKFNE